MTIADRLRAACSDGSLSGCSTWQEVAQRLGVGERRIREARAALGAEAPTLEELRGARPARPSLSIREDKPSDQDFADEPTQPGMRWPSVEAFDSETAPAEPPPLPALPDGHRVRGVSTLVDAVTGESKLQWIKTSAVNDERADWLEAIRDMGGELPRIEPTPAPSHSNEDLLVVLPVGDPHVGLNAWWEDAGENFDMEIAERNLIAAFQNLIERAPSAAMALLIFIGDNSHVDNQNNTTTAGTRQDADSRTVKIARTIIRIFRRSIDMALAKFGGAHVKIERGNHDELISAMVALALSLLYENEPRVTVDTSPEMYHWFRWGSVLIGTHHGDKAKPMDLLGVMAVDRAADWSETKHRRFYCGHLHHQIVKEVPGLIVEYLPTLAGSDAWHRGMGYRSQRAMYMDVFHRERGHVDRHIVGIAQLQGAA